MQVMASDADDPTYGSSARVVYSVLEGEQHFTVDSKTGEQHPAGLGCQEADCGCASGISPLHGCVQQACASVLAPAQEQPCHGQCRVLGGSLAAPQAAAQLMAVPAARAAAASPARPAECRRAPTGTSDLGVKGLSTTRGALPKVALLSPGL